MQGIYGKATVCDYNNKTNCNLFLEPGGYNHKFNCRLIVESVIYSCVYCIFVEITERFVNSRDPEELKWLWEAWRNASGREVRKFYPTYVDLSNEAARLNS